jgi:hypothetical protein
MDARAALLALEDSFVHRHVAPTESAIAAMLDAVGLLQLGSSSISVQAGGQFGTQGIAGTHQIAAAAWSHDEPRTDEPGGQIELQFQQLDQPGT